MRGLFFSRETLLRENYKNIAVAKTKKKLEVIPWPTHDLGCATALISAGFTLIALDKENPRKVGFIFHGNKKLAKAAEDYFSDKLIVNARKFFDNLRMLKNRIYGQ
jgi:hypothetical protein